MNGWCASLSRIIQESIPVAVINAHEYPSLLISLVLTLLKKRGRSVIKLEVTADNISHIILQLSSSFLGSSYTYWLSGIHELDAADSKALLQFLNTYTGPHSVLFFLMADERQPVPNALVTIAIPEHISHQDFLALLVWYDARLKERPAVLEMVQQIFAQYQTISIEQAMLFLEYVPLIGKSTQEFMQQWLPRLMSTEQSLFALSQAFFAKNLSACLSLWHQMHDQYVEQFWTAYWSEQLFRAHYVLRALNTLDTTIDIKRISSRLPYSFIKRDYKRWSLEQLSQAHQIITNVELDLKAGACPLQLDTFYMKAITL